MKTRSIAALLFILLACVPLAAQSRYYQVRSIHDGDTVRLVGIKKGVRLLGISAPEVSGPFGRVAETYGYESRAALMRLLNCIGQPTKADKDAVDCTSRVRLGFGPKSRVDRCNDRLLYYLFLPDGTNVSLAMVSDGYARFEPRFRTRYAKALRVAEVLAKNEKKGLWSDGN